MDNYGGSGTPQQTQQTSGSASPLGMIGAQGASNLAGAIIGQIFNRSNMKAQQKAQESLMRQSQQYGKEMWDYTNYENQVKHMKAAGLNPGLAYGMGGGGGVTTGTQPGGGAAMGQTPTVQPMDIAQLSLLKAQKENIEADTANKVADTANKPKTGQEIDSRTANNMLDGIIKDYTGREAKDTYEIIDKPLRAAERDAKAAEYLQKDALGSTIYELWREGKLKEKGLAEIEAIAIGNAKNRADEKRITKQIDLIEKQIKGQDLQNMLDEVNVKMTGLGITADSPYYLKMAGILLSKLFGL